MRIRAIEKNHSNRQISHVGVASDLGMKPLVDRDGVVGGIEYAGTMDVTLMFVENTLK